MTASSTDNAFTSIFFKKTAKNLHNPKIRLTFAKQFGDIV